MLTLTRPSPDHDAPCGPVRGVITLTFDQRTRSRLRACADDGRDVAIHVERGGLLRDGDRLHSASGETFLVHAAAESVSAVYCSEARKMAQLCYHLGNRHVSLEIGIGRIAYETDHVLDAMVRGLGFEPVTERAPFDPQGGAYGGRHDHGHTHSPGGTSRGHDHGHDGAR